MNFRYLRSSVFLAACLLAGCGDKEEAYTEKTFLMNVPAQVKVYGAGEAEGKRIAEAVLAEWRRIASEFGYTDPYSQTSVVNKKAYGEWVKADEEFMRLLRLAMDYYRLTGGAFDITFAPLWPIWKEAASTRKMPAKEDISKALANMGSAHVQADHGRRQVRFLKPVQINMGGILRGYCFTRAYRILKELAPAYPVELRLGSNMLAYGVRPWRYDVMDPFDDDKRYGSFEFGEGVIMSSSGREHFVQIEGRLYSHILDIKTGYPVENFSNLVVYFPKMEGDNFIPSAVLAVMGREKAFGLLGGMKGTAAVWIDGSGKENVFLGQGTGAVWQKAGRFF